MSTGYEVSPGRPIARLVASAVTGVQPKRRTRRGPYVPPPAVPAGAASTAPADAVELSARLLRGLLLGGEDGADLPDRLAPDVVAWSPSVFAVSRDAVLDALRGRDADGDTLTGVAVDVTASDVVGPRAYLEWRLTGRFTNPCFVDDDLLVEPTGRLVETSGALVVVFGGDQVSSVHCYHDDLALLEQLIIL